MPSKRAAAAHLRDIKRKVIEATIEAMDDASSDIQGDLKKVVKKWRHKPTFEDDKFVSKNRIELTIKPKGRNAKQFNFVDKGTKGPYIIHAVNVPRLKFQVGYSARTAPVAKYNVGSGRRFGAWASPKTVIHPGIKARKFIETLTEELIPSLKDRIDASVTRKLAK